MATQKEMQDKIDALEAELAAKPAPTPDEDSAARIAELEAKLAAQEAVDAARADVKMVRLKHESGSIVNVDADTAKGLTEAAGWTKIK